MDDSSSPVPASDLNLRDVVGEHALLPDLLGAMVVDDDVVEVVQLTEWCLV